MRVLVAVVVAATALGPILVAITGDVQGPLSALADLYVGPNAYSDTSPNRDLADILMSVMPALAGAGAGRGPAPWTAVRLVGRDGLPRIVARPGDLLRHRLLQLGRRQRRTGPGLQLDRLAAAVGAAAGADHHHAGSDQAIIHRAGTCRDLPEVRPQCARRARRSLGALCRRRYHVRRRVHPQRHLRWVDQ